MKDQDLFGISNKYIAECFVTFEQIVSTDPSEQMHLKLSRPTVTGSFEFCNFNEKLRLISIFSKKKNSPHTDCDCLNALKLREGDKLAREFTKKIKQKLP